MKRKLKPKTQNLKPDAGQSLVEIMIAIAIGAILIGGATAIIVPILRSNLETRNVQIANSLAQEYLDNLESLAESDWQIIYSPPSAKGPSSQFYLAPTSTTFMLVSGTTSTIVEDRTFTRYFSIENVNRNLCGADEITTDATSICTSGPGSSGVADDPSTQKITAAITWPEGRSISKIQYLTRNVNKVFVQTDWSGGSGYEGPITSENNRFASSTNITYTASTTSASYSAGYNSPATLANDSSIGAVAWSSPQNAAASDNSYATSSSSGTQLTNYLKATNFGFNIPSDATITGIEVGIERKAGPSTNTLTIQPSIDTALNGGYPGVNYGSSIGFNVFTITYQWRSILKFDFSSLPAGAVISAATLNLYYYQNIDIPPVGRTYWAYELTQTGWIEMQATWNNYDVYNGWVSPGGDYQDTSYGASTVMPASFGWVNWNVLALVSHFQSAHSKIAHFLIKDGTENNADSGASFYSRDYTTDLTLRPKLIITYTTPGSAQDNQINIVKSNGSIGTTNKAKGDSWPTSDAVATYGGSSDLWGETWTSSDINNSNFGVVVSASSTDSTVNIDQIQLKVYYTYSTSTSDAGSIKIQGF